jgi:hypothetical protein
MAMDSRPATVILIHGTWPRGPLKSATPPIVETAANKLWYEPDSSFAGAIARYAGVPVHFESLIWSGRNGLADRFDAAERLAQRLRQLASEHPDGRQFVVAHSHGGNVALAGAILLGAGASPLGVVTMGTPFLYIEERTPTGFQRVMSWLGGMILVCFAFVATLFFPLFVWGWYRGSDITELETAALVWAGFFAFGLTGMLMDRTVKRWHQWWDRANYRLRVLSPRYLPCDFLVIRGKGDEASAALALGVLGAKATRWMRELTIESGWFQKGLRWLLGGLYLLFCVAMFLLVLFAPLCRAFDFFAYERGAVFCATLTTAITSPPQALGTVGAILLYALMFGLPIVTGLFLLTESFITSLYGTDSIIYGLRFTITAETKPRRGDSAHVIEEPEIVDDHGLHSLSHSLHQLPEVPRQIGTWIRDR